MGLSLKKIGRSITDIFDANSKEDQRKRIAAGQSRYYADQQRAMGNQRPANNLGQAFFGNAARTINTLGGVARETPSTLKLVTAMATNNAKARDNALEDVKKVQQATRNPNAGLFGAGTIYKNANDTPLMGETARRFGTSYLAGAGELAPIPATKTVKGANLAIKAGKVGLASSAANVAADAGNQYINKGKIDLKQSAVAGATGLALGTAAPVAWAGTKGATKLATNKVSNLIDNRVPLNQAGGIKINNPLSAKTGLLINNPDGAKYGGLKINNPDGAQTKPIKVTNPMGAKVKEPPIKVKNNTGAPLVGENLSGAAQQSRLSKIGQKDPLESLKQEARKYGSAEEFARKIGFTTKEVGDNYVLYKGTGGDLDMGGSTGFDYFKKVADSKASMPKDTTSYTQNFLRAQDYGKVKAFSIPKSAVLDEGAYTDLLIKQLEKVDGVKYTPADIASVKQYPTAYSGFWRRADKYPSLISDIKKSGYKAFKDTNGEVVVLDKKAVTDLYSQATKNKLGLTKMGEDGFVKVPGGKRDPAPDLSPERKTFINDYANMLEGMDSGNGVSIMPDGTRATSNSPFYRSVYAEKGRPPTKEEWFNEARVQIESGKGAYGASEDYAKLPQAIAKQPKPKVTQKAKQAQPAPKVSQKTVDSLPNNNIDDQLQKEILGNADVNYSQGVLGQLGEKLSPNRQIRKVTGAVETGINKVLRGSLESGSRTVRTPGRVAAGVSRQSGKTAEELAQYGRLQGGKQLGDELAIKVAKTGEEAVQGGVRPDRVAAALDPELTKATGGKMPDLTPNEAAEVARLRKIIDLTHEGEYAIGLLDEKAYKANKGTYFPRNFDAFFDNDVTRQIAKHNKLDLNIFKQRSELADIPKEVLEKANKDPYYMTALRVQQYAKNKAVVDHTKWLAQNGSILDAPKKGYIQVPDSPAYGAIKGKYVLKEQLEDLQGFIYETDTAQHIMALLNTYDRNPARQFLKKTKTVYNPGVRLGNRTFNYLTAGINGINPITYTKNWARASKMMHKQSPEFLEATREGVFGSSIIDKELYQVSDALTPVKGNAATKGVRTADNFISNTYRGVDDKGKMATYLTFRERGLSPADAAERTRRAMQNYDMVGHFFDQGAKTPIGGNAFVRFSSELMRIAHNSAVDNPLRLAGAVASVVALTNMASQLSGESPEDRRTREGRLGAPRVPFTNQSLEVQTPYGAINIGRLLGITTYNDLVGGVAEDSKRLMPFQPPVTNTPDGVKFNPNFITSDPLVGGIVGQAIDKDFRGKSIKDPENSGQFQEPLSTKSQLANRAQTAAMGYIPLANEANSLYSAVRGQESFYGKKRSPVQAGLRVAGIKVEQYGPEQAKKQRATDEYFKEKAKLDKEVATLPKRDQEAYKRATGYYKLREQVDNEFSPGDKRYKKDAVYNFPEDKWKEYTTSPKLYEMIKKDKERKFKKQGQPIQPEFDNRLSNEFRKQLINNKSQAPGEDVEADQRLYTSSEWDLYEQIKKEYSTAASKYYPARKDGTFTDELVKRQNAPFPNKPPAKKAYDDAYAAYAKGQGPKPQYNDAVDAAKQQYSDAKFKWTNDERKARGLPPLSKEVWDNVTFGFESDEEKVYKQLKYGKGYGGYGSSSGGSSGSKGFDPYEYAVSLGSNKTPKPKVYQAKQRKIAKAKISKPKVTIKKSKV